MRAFLALLLLSSPAIADMWGEWHAKRVTDPAGRYYVVLRYDKDSHSARYSYAEVGPLAPPVEDQEYEAYENWVLWGAGSGLREGDRVIRRGGIETPPYDVLVSATGKGFVCIEEWWGLGYGNSVTIVNADGSPEITRKLADLFTPRTIHAFPSSVSSIWWLRDAWIDDEAGRVVVVAVDGRMRTVGWADGVVRDGTDADIVSALALPHDAAKRLALELVAERRIKAAKEACIALLDDRTELLSIRLRAAAALAAIGDPRGRDLIVSIADIERVSEDEEDEEDTEYAFAHLPDVLGEKAIPILTEAIRREVAGARSGFFALGHRALPALERIAADEGSDAAVDVLGWLGAREAIPAIARAASVAKDTYAAEAILRVLEHLTEPEERVPHLLEVLRRGTLAPHSVARSLKLVKCPEAVPLLVAALEDAPEDLHKWERSSITDALKFQTGEDLGDDPEAWRRWLDDSK